LKFRFMLSAQVIAPCRRRCLQYARRTFATETQIPVPAASAPKTTPGLSTAIILNRSPFLTKPPTPFERAYYAYQARIRRALHNPFPYDFYFKQGSLLETRFSMEERTREKQNFGPEFVSEDLSSAESEEAMAAVEMLRKQESEGQVFIPRVHRADVEKDLKSLDRNGQRNLYLLLKTQSFGKERWRFPQGDVVKGDLLHQAAQRDLHAECGNEMDTWIVSRNPIGVYKPPTDSESTTFFFKAHIMAGQAQIQSPSVSDFAWLTKQEIQEYAEPHYWEGVRDMLSDY
jgi:large subunit ribosomal protein L46